MSSKGLFGEDARTRSRDRAAAIKARLTVQSLARIMGYEVIEAEAGFILTCPCCKTDHALKVDRFGRSYRCVIRECGAKGDVITFRMQATGEDFASACHALEQRAITSPRDHDTSDLFAGKAVRS